MGLNFIETLKRIKPKFLILAGDRGEQLMGAIAAAYSYVPIAHIQAGEKSGNIDGTTRHAIARFAHVHFASNKDATDRLLHSGEEKFRIHNVGAPQLDEIRARGSKFSTLYAGLRNKSGGARAAASAAMNKELKTTMNDERVY